MKDFTLSAIWAIFQEVLGIWFLPAIIVLTLFALLTAFTLARKKLRISRLGIPLLLGIVAGVIAAGIAPMMTDAQFSDLQNTLDYVTLTLIALGTCLAVATVSWVLSAAFSKPNLPSLS